MRIPDAYYEVFYNVEPNGAAEADSTPICVRAAGKTQSPTPLAKAMGDYIVGAANSAACAPESAALASADACKNASAMLDLAYADTKDDPAMPSGCFKQARPHAPL